MTNVLTSAADLRAAFDLRFAEPAAAAPGRAMDFLAIRVVGGACAVPIGEISALVTDRPVTALPGSDPHLLGLSSFRGTVVLVYDLAALLGHGRSAHPRWALLSPGPSLAALAFDDLAGHVRVLAPGAGEPAHEIVQFAGTAWPVVSIPSLLEAVNAIDRPRPQKER